MSRLQSPVHQWRFFALVTGLLFAWIILEANLVRFQIVDSDRLSEYARRQYESEVILEAQRGTIYDRSANKLATNIIYYDIAADPLLVENKQFIAASLAKSFPKSKTHYLRKMNQNSHFTYLERKTTQDAVKPLLSFKDPGLIRIENFGRFYPYGTYAGQLIGFTDPDDHGLSGLELQFEKQLAGKDGKAILQYDAIRGVAYNSDYPRLKPTPGTDIYLTIDKDIQTVVEKSLKIGVDNAHAKSGIAVVMDPNSGAILAMANYPGFDPNNHNTYDDWHKKNRAVTDEFEPGSTMKMFTAAAILQERKHKPEDIVFCENGRLKIYDHYIRDTKKYGWLTFRKVIENSSNVGMIKLSEILPSSVLFRYLKNFGFGSETNVGLIGEAEGSLASPEQWSGLSKASISIGQEIGVTAVQITAAFSSLVNGGFLFKPYAVLKVIDPAENEVLFQNRPEKIRQIISPEVGEILKTFMKGAVENGTAKKAKVDHLVVGGKTGTAQKFDREKKHYKLGTHLSSFIGFAPYDNPRYVCAIFVDDPQGFYYGGDVAAPVFSKIISQIAHFETEPRNQDVESNSGNYIYVDKINSLPRMEGFKVQTTTEYLEDRDFDVKINGTGSFIKTINRDGDNIVLSSMPGVISLETMPNLKGLTIRQALSQIDFSKLRVSIDGSGKVVKQSISPGTSLKEKKQLLLGLR